LVFITEPRIVELARFGSPFNDSSRINGATLCADVSPTRFSFILFLLIPDSFPVKASWFEVLLRITQIRQKEAKTLFNPTDSGAGRKYCSKKCP